MGKIAEARPDTAEDWKKTVRQVLKYYDAWDLFTEELAAYYIGMTAKDEGEARARLVDLLKNVAAHTPHEKLRNKIERAARDLEG